MGMRKLLGFKLEKDITEPIPKKFRLCLDTLKAAQNRTCTIDELIAGMGYKNGRANRKAAEVVIYKLKSMGCLTSILEHLETTPSQERRLFVEQSPAMTAWMRRLRSEETKEKFLYLFMNYFEWVRAKKFFDSPDAMLLHKQKAQTDTDRYYHISLIEDFFAESKLNAWQKKSTYTAIRSFYKHCKGELPSYPLNFKDKTGMKPIVSQQPITLDEMRQLLIKAKPREQAMFLIQLQSGMDRSTFAEYFNLYSWPQLVKQLGNEDPAFWDLSKAPIQLDLFRVKTHVQYYSYLSVDALKALQAWLNVRKTLTNKPMQNGEPIFISLQRTPVKKEQLSYLFNQLAISAGLESRKYGKASEIRYRFHEHEIRDTFRTACTVSGVAHPVAEFFIGHSIDKLGYDKSPQVYPEHFKNEYSKVEPMLNIFSNQTVGMKKLEELETKITEKEAVIQSLIENGRQKNGEFEVVQKRLFELERKEAERVKAERLKEAKDLEDFRLVLDGQPLKYAERLLVWNPNRPDLLEYLSKRRVLEAKQEPKTGRNRRVKD
jgi:hypothetical protein